jgi:flagellar L-ring protein FlgH
MKKYCFYLIYFLAVGCSSTLPQKTGSIPSLEYSKSVNSLPNPYHNSLGKNFHFISEPGDMSEFKSNKMTTPESAYVDPKKDFPTTTLDPTSYSDAPNDSPSLWREAQSRGGLFQDFRAWKPMDLLTIVVREITEGRKEADTSVIRNNTLEAGMNRFLGIETTLGDRNTQVSPPALLDVSTTNNYIGEGETVRRGSLTGTISGMIVEVLPSGILRVEGKKIIAVNDEEQVMVISGLVRTRDINSNNEIDSAKIANMRIDYYGEGMVADAQSPGFITRILMKLWPF